jgi:DNA polymerase III delta subunit
MGIVARASGDVQRYWLVGSDAFRVERERDGLAARLGPGVEVRRADGRADLDELALWLRSTGFFDAAGPRLLFWDHPDGRQVKGSGFDALCRSTAADRWLAVWVDKGMRPEGFQEVEVAPLRGSGWDALVRQIVREEGVTLDPQALLALGRACHPSGHQVVQAARLLKLAAGDRPVSLAEVEALVQPLEGDALYRLTDALILRDTETAYRELRQQLERGAEPILVLGAMSRQMSQLAGFMDARTQGAPPPQAAERAGLRSFQTRTFGRAAAVWSLAELSHWFDRARAVDRALKSSRLDPDSWLSALVLQGSPRKA